VSVATFANALPLPGWPGESGPGYGGVIGFVGRFTEPRKGFVILRDAFVSLAAHRPGLRLLVVGRGDPDEVLEDVPAALRERIVFLGMTSDAEKARMLRSIDVYVAPNTGGESFGMVLTEAMAAGAPVIASDLDAFRRVLDGGRAGVLFPNGDVAALASAMTALLDDPARRAEQAALASEVVAGYDWPEIAMRVLEVYATAIEAASGTVIYEEVPTGESHPAEAAD
jgi:phosphatidylinositol alpha-mannosyltransferase